MNIREIKGIGPKKESLLNKLNIFTIEDLLEYYPIRYEDRCELKKLKEVNSGELGLFYLKIISNPSLNYPKRKMSILKCKATDGINTVELTWFNNSYLKNQLKVNEYYYFFGKLKKHGRNIEIESPIIEKTYGRSIGKIYPIYSLTKGLTNNELNNFISEALSIFEINNIIPEVIIEKNFLLNRKSAIKNIHFPENKKILSLARKTLKFEELLVLQTALNFNIINTKDEGIYFKINEKIYSFIDKLPFKLTNGQINVIKDIFIDMNSSKSMNRLIQGDVGSGKTIIAAIGMLLSFYNGYQSTIMAPTEILATQHFNTLKELYKDIDLNIALLKGSLTIKQKQFIYEKIKNNEIDILVGTHAIIEDSVKFKNLGLVITDEQHRFGVNQRAKISNKGNVDTLIMTATPIPRTLALAMYGDLDVSIIDSLPPGRREIETFVINMNYEKRVMDFLIKQIKNGNQGYIVCPLIDESEKLELNSVIELFERLKNSYLKEIEIDFIHGKMKNEEKEKIMDKFISEDIKVLFSTTVIEVGVNVPKANIMIIYNAERFGLSQLHQLRGRVGRGDSQSYCILINNSNSSISRERMRIIQSSNNGFEIAKKDLELRGSGDIIGLKQSGLPSLKIANIYEDIKLLEYIQPIAKKIILNDLLKNKEYKNLSTKVNKLIKIFADSIILN